MAIFPHWRAFRRSQPHGHLLARADAVYYSYVFDLGSNLDASRLATRLLKADIAEVASTPSSDISRLSPRYRGLYKLKRRAENIGRLARELEEGRLPHRLMIRQTLKAYFTVILPALVRLYAQALLIPGRRRNQEDRASSTQQRSSATTPSKDYRREAASMRETAKAIEDGVRSAELQGGARNAMDRILFSPNYIGRNPYLRLQLRRARVCLALTAEAPRGGPEGTTDSDSPWVEVDTSLQVYSTGMCVLTLSMVLDRDADVGTLRPFTHSQSLILASSEVAAPILESAARRTDSTLMGEWREEVTEGVKWRHISHSDNASMRDLFTVYLHAVLDVSGEDLTNDWLGYTTLFFTGRCCGSKRKAHSNHLQELASLAGRYPTAATLDTDHAERLITGPLPFESEEIWVQPNNAIHASWEVEPPPINVANHYLMLGPLQHAVTNAHHLNILDRNSRRSKLTTREISGAQNRLLFGLENYNPLLITSRDGQAVARRLYGLWDTEALHQRLLDRVSLLGDILDQRRATKLAARGAAISFISLLTALIVGLPAIHASLRLLAVERSWLQGLVVAGASSTGGVFPLALVVYATFVALVLVALVIMYLTGRIGGLGNERRQHLVGVEWPDTGLSVTAGRSSHSP